MHTWAWRVGPASMDRPASRAHGPAASEPSRHGGRGDRRARSHGRVRARRGTDRGVWRPAGPAGWLRAAAGVVIIGPGEVRSLGSVDTGFRRALGGSSHRMVLARRTFRRRVFESNGWGPGAAGGVSAAAQARSRRVLSGSATRALACIGARRAGRLSGLRKRGCGTKPALRACYRNPIHCGLHGAGRQGVPQGRTPLEKS